MTPAIADKTLPAGDIALRGNLSALVVPFPTGKVADGVRVRSRKIAD